MAVNWEFDSEDESKLEMFLTEHLGELLDGPLTEVRWKSIKCTYYDFALASIAVTFINPIRSIYACNDAIFRFRDMHTA